MFPEKCFGCESYLTIPRPSSDSFSRSTLVHRPCKNNLRSQLIICRNLTTGNPSVNLCRWQSWCWMAACVMCLWTVPVRVSVWLWLWVCVICSVLVLFFFYVCYTRFSMPGRGCCVGSVASVLLACWASCRTGMLHSGHTFLTSNHLMRHLGGKKLIWISEWVVLN